MNHLLIKHNPIAGMKFLEIFEGQSYEGSKVYPVRIDGFYIMFEKLESGWAKKGMAFVFSPKVIEYVISLLEEYENSLG